MTKTLSYNNDPKLKKDMVSEMKIHQEQDDFIKGSYAHQNGRFKGCAVGCGVQSLNIKRGLTIKHDDHASYAKAIGIPEWLARLEDTLFENLPEEEAKKFPLAFTKSIPIGVDLEPVKWKFCAFILKENIERVLLLKIDDKLKEQVVSAIQGVLSLHEKAVETGKWDESAAWAAWAAESAAKSAAKSAAWAAGSAAWAAESATWAAESAAWAAESAAWAAGSAAWAAGSAAWAAESAAKSAAKSAAWAAFQKYAKELLRLIVAEGKKK